MVGWRGLGALGGVDGRWVCCDGGGGVEDVDGVWRRKVNNAQAGSTAFVVTKWSVLALFGGRNSPEARTMSRTFTTKRHDCHDGGNGIEVLRCI